MNKVQELELASEWAVINNFALAVAEEFLDDSVPMVVELVDPTTSADVSIWSREANLFSDLYPYRIRLLTVHNSIVAEIGHVNDKHELTKLGRVQLSGMSETGSLIPVVTFLKEAAKTVETEAFLQANII
jgi:hypothetical protein